MNIVAIVNRFFIASNLNYAALQQTLSRKEGLNIQKYSYTNSQHIIIHCFKSPQNSFFQD